MNEPVTKLIELDETPTRLCAPGVRYALLARERAALARTELELPASLMPTPTTALVPPRSRRPTRRALLAGALGAVVLMTGSAVAVAWQTHARAAVPRRAVTTPRRLPASEPARHAAVPVASAAQAPSAATAPPPTLRRGDAAAWLADGDYGHAASAYRALTTAYPDEPVFKLVGGVLERRLAERCRARASDARGACP